MATTVGYKEHDPNCDLDIVPNQARQTKVKAVISNVCAFGGLNAVIALKSI